MITGFKDAETEKVFNGIRSRRFEAIASTAYRKLAFLHSAGTLHDLRSPGLHLEALRATGPASTASGSTTRYRICFVWRDGQAADVEIVDYH